MEAKLRLKRRMERSGAAGDGDDSASEDEAARLTDLKAPAFKRQRRFENRERVLVFCSRGVTSKFRHLMEDVRKLLPHHKKEVKLDARANLANVVEICDIKRCNSCMFFESRKRQDMYLWMARTPSGPSVKFHVTNIHTMDELKLTGNCMMGSRPLLQFDPAFDSTPHLRLLKEMFTHTWSTPKGHPKSKPFVDHVFSFNVVDGRIWFRNYQIIDRSIDKKEASAMRRAGEDPLQLVEVGPRMVLEVIRIFDAPFGGATLFDNGSFVSPNVLRREARRAQGSKYVDRVAAKEGRKMRQEELVVPRTGLEDVFV